MANVVDCDILISDFEPHFHYYVHFHSDNLTKSIKSSFVRLPSQLVATEYTHFISAEG